MGWTVRRCGLGTRKEENTMTAFDRAWMLAKMPMYHGTSEEAWRDIQQEGLKPTDRLGYDEGELANDETRYAWAHGDRGYPHPHKLGPGGVPSAIFNSLSYADDGYFGPSRAGTDTYDGKGVVLEISDDAPGFREAPIGRSDGQRWKHQAGRDIRISPETIPPEFIRRLSGDEINAGLRAYSQFRQAEEERRKLMMDLEWSRLADREAVKRILYGDGAGNGYADYKDDYQTDVARPYWPVSHEQKAKWSEYPDMVRE